MAGKYIYKNLRDSFFAQASCDETRVHLETAFEREYITKEQLKEIDEKLDHIGRMLFRLAAAWKNNSSK